MILRFLLLSAFVLLSSIVGGAAKSLAATDGPASFVSDLASRALAPMPNEDTAVKQERFRQLFRQYFDVESCARSALGPYRLKATAPQRPLRRRFRQLFRPAGAQHVWVNLLAAFHHLGHSERDQQSLQVAP